MPSLFAMQSNDAYASLILSLSSILGDQDVSEESCAAFAIAWYNK